MLQKIENLDLIFNSFQVKIPRKNSPLDIKPLPELVQPSSLDDKILQIMGVPKQTAVKQKQSFSFFSLMPSCGALSCKAASKQTLHQLNRQPDIEDERQKYLKDPNRKISFQKIYNRYFCDEKKSKSKNNFQRLYNDFCHTDEKQWEKILKKQKQQK